MTTISVQSVVETRKEGVGMKGITVLSAKPIDHEGKWDQQGRSIPAGNDDVPWRILKIDDIGRGFRETQDVAVTP